jgi:uncharacterized protein YecE (DUF72 family)
VIRVGTAGWSIPRAVADRFATQGSGLQRYAARFSFAEINTSFYRPHRKTTYERWAGTTPEGFRFAVKLPKAITHEARLDGGEAILDRFLDETGGLGAKRGPVLIQLPPSLTFDPAVAGPFLAAFRERYDGEAACEPRHPSWFGAEAQDLLSARRVARVAADPAPAPPAASPGGFPGFAYHRLHGSPAMYRSAYGQDRIGALAAALLGDGRPAYVVFDNTTLGHAAQDALLLTEHLGAAGLA